MPLLFSPFLILSCHRAASQHADDGKLQHSGIWVRPIVGAEYVRSIQPIPGYRNVLGWSQGASTVAIISPDGSIIKQEDLSSPIDGVKVAGDEHLLIYFENKAIGGQPAYESVRAASL